MTRIFNPVTQSFETDTSRSPVYKNRNVRYTRNRPDELILHFRQPPIIRLLVPTDKRSF